jgi:hypothetical protein
MERDMNENVRVIARHSDGTETDVTEGVQALYDHCVASMDWGSGFLSVEEATGIILIAQKCGFLVPDTAAKAFASYIENDNSAHITYDGRLQKRERGAAQCVRCNPRVWYMPTFYKPEVYAQHGVTGGWHHDDEFLDGSHAVSLWQGVQA